MRMFWFVFLRVSCVNVSLCFGQLVISICDFEAQCCSVFVTVAELLFIA